MKKQLILLFTLAFAGIFSAAAQDPIYVVNGQVVSDIRNIPPGDIESTEMLPADEQTIARYGTEASNGVTHHPAIRHPGSLPGSRRQLQRLYFRTDRLG